MNPTHPPPRPGVRRRGPVSGSRIAGRIGLVVVLLVVLAAGIFGYRALWKPRLDPVPDHVDAIVQLGGVPQSDYWRVRELAGQGRSPDLVLSSPPEALKAEVCAPLSNVRVDCFVPDPFSTRGEARAIRDLAAERGWRRILVYATNEHHVARARYIIGRCFPGELSVTYWTDVEGVRGKVKQGIYQAGGWAKALTEDGC